MHHPPVDVNEPRDKRSAGIPRHQLFRSIEMLGRTIAVTIDNNLTCLKRKENLVAKEARAGRFLYTIKYLYARQSVAHHKDLTLPAGTIIEKHNGKLPQISYTDVSQLHANSSKESFYRIV